MANVRNGWKAVIDGMGINAMIAAMRDEAIVEVGADERGRLLVRPAGTAFDMIFRTASGVDWDEHRQALVSPVPRDWTLERWFAQVLAAVAGEYGVVLKISPQTTWTAIPPEIQRNIEAISNSDWVTPLLSEWKQNDARYWRDYQLKEALSQADQLWAKERYAEYVCILAPHRDELSPAQQKRLTIAEQRAHS